MPEDVHPRIDPGSVDLCHYFSLTMALNYQRDSFALWRAATAAYNDAEARVIFCPSEVSKLSNSDLADLLLRHRVALQPTKHTGTWKRLCDTIAGEYEGDIRNLFSGASYDIGKILEVVRVERKKLFPYLSGPKIANYWLYVLIQYTALPFTNRRALSIAPDTHVMQATHRLGLAVDENRPEVIAGHWQALLANTDITPIDVHTPLWLWSRGGFRVNILRP